MDIRRIGRSTAARSVALAGAAAMIGLLSVPAASASSHSAAKKKKLSLAAVSIGASFNGDFGQEWIAQSAGFFKQQGLTVTFDNISGQSTAVTTAAFLAGGFNYINNAATSIMVARQQGAPIEALFADDYGQQQEITINAATAAALHIPSAGSTPAQAVAQIEALKGTHLTVAVTTTAATSYVDLVALCHIYNLTCAVNAPTDDVNFTLVGSSTSQVAGYAANKFPAYATNPPQSVQANGLSIQVGLIAPFSQANGLYFASLDTFVEAHPDTTQAVVNALVEAWAYSKTHPVAAERMENAMWAVSGITSPDEDEYLWTGSSKFWKSPLLLRAGFQKITHIINYSQTPAITLTFNQWNQPKFVNKAVATLKLGVVAPTVIKS